MKRVILLTEDEKRDYNFKVPKISFVSPLLCRETDDAAAFVYERFGFFTANQKLDDYIACTSGVIVIISYKTMTKDKDAIESRLQKIQCRPMLLILHDSPDDLTHAITSTSVSFQVVYENRGTNIEPFLKMFTAQLEEPSVPVSAENISNEDMISMFETCILPLSAWNHYGRIRVVYLALKMHGYKDSIDPDGWLCRNWKKYKTSVGHGSLWNYTLTRFWVEIVAHARDCSGHGFRRLWHTVDILRDPRLHKEFYSQIRLMNSDAKAHWVPPDLKPLELHKPSRCLTM